MSDHLSVDLSKDDCELLLRGLRFVRSRVMLDICDPSPKIDRARQEQLREIEVLVEQLSGAKSVTATANV